MKVWITKYCLTMGIQEIEVEVSSFNDDTVIKVKNKESTKFQCDEFYHGRNKEWHTTKDSAIKKAEEMKSKKIESLKRQLEKIESIQFD